MSNRTHTRQDEMEQAGLRRNIILYSSKPREKKRLHESSNRNSCPVPGECLRYKSICVPLL